MPGNDDLNAAQLDGLACVVCGMPFVETDEAAVPVGGGPRGQLFACARHCESDSGSDRGTQR
jgi:hypothetical protein